MGQRTKPRKDGNHGRIVGLADNVCDAVFDAAGVGGGFPDIMVAFRGDLYIAEIKDPAQPPSKRRLSPAEVKFHNLWGRVVPNRIGIVETDDDFLSLIGF